ncbi:MAG: HlyD family efflux transporter periplasmic adaptor subunit [Syntrophomonas sp.]
MPKHKVGLLVIILLLLSGGSYLVYKEYFSEHSSGIQATGTIEATTVDLNAKSSGTIAILSIEEGNNVKQDQLVAVLSRSDLEAQKERDAMGVLSAEAKQDDLLSGARSQGIKEATANVNMAKISYDKSTTDLNRVEALFKEGAISQEQLDQARVNTDLKKNQLDAAEAKLSLLQAGNRPDVLEGAQAEVEKSKAVLQASQSVLEDLKVYSPINGTVLSRNYEPGEFVQMGAALATVADLNKLWVKVYIPTDDLPAIKLRQKVHFTVSGDDHQYTGEIINIASKGEFTPKTIQTKKERTNVVFAVKIGIKNESGVLKPGMPADVVFN